MYLKLYSGNETQNLSPVLTETTLQLTVARQN